MLIADGSRIWMPNTPETRAGLPEAGGPAAGVGFPLARITVLLSLATGTCHDLALAPYAGPGTGEPTLLRHLRLAFPRATSSWLTPCSTTTSPHVNSVGLASNWSPA